MSKYCIHVLFNIEQPYTWFKPHNLLQVAEPIINSGDLIFNKNNVTLALALVLDQILHVKAILH